MVDYLDCMERVVSSVCGEKTGAWQRRVTTMILRTADYDKHCTAVNPVGVDC